MGRGSMYENFQLKFDSQFFDRTNTVDVKSMNLKSSTSS